MEKNLKGRLICESLLYNSGRLIQMCWRIATAPLDNSVLLKRKKKRDILYFDLFLWENGYYFESVSTHSCYYGSLFAVRTSGEKYYSG